MLFPLVKQYVELSVACRDFFIVYNKVDDAACKVLNINGVRIRQLSVDCPNWLSELCKQVVLDYFIRQESEKLYSHHFLRLDDDVSFPEDIQICWGVLSTDDMKDVERRRSQQIADWLHGEASKWTKKTDDENKGVRDKDRYVI